MRRENLEDTTSRTRDVPKVFPRAKGTTTPNERSRCDGAGQLMLAVVVSVSVAPSLSVTVSVTVLCLLVE